uniref:Tyrosine-protein phosphatase non-receptor type 23 n=1 Tax=Glossina pallidipes TaxID=7398 RepID=A0A1B0AJE8_GLOPL
MEAVPRLHMVWFPSKTSPEGTSFSNLKKYIAEFYQEDPDAYSKEVFALETLRNQALNTTKDNCTILKRYYCQLHSLQNRFPQLLEKSLFTFTWKGLYDNKVHEYSDLRYEQAAVLFNIATAHTQTGASVTRGDVDGMKLACTHFQCAAWAFGELRERYANDVDGDMLAKELLVFMQQVSFAQAQECILEKSLLDNRKPNIVAKVTAQIVVYYGAALAALLTGGDEGPIKQLVENSVYKLWKKYVRFKISYLNCILYLYQAQHAEEQRKMGERLTLYEAAWEKLEEARKESKGLPDQKEINESLIFTADVVEAKRKNAKNENEFIYHEAVPELNTIAAVQGANLVNGISFSITDPEVAGEDIFARLVPMKAHEASSMYSEEKAKLLRKYGAKIEEKDGELASFMTSLSLENLNINEEKANKIPQGVVDRCADLNANKSAIPELIKSMSRLADICNEVEAQLHEIGNILALEENEEREFQQLSGLQRTPNAHITELSREYQKYTEAHNKAGDSNDTLRKAMELHINNLKILAKPLQEVQQSVPKLSSELNTAEIFKDVKLIVNKVNEMKAQRSQFHADLRIAVNEDDITAKVIAHGKDEGLQHLFDRELSKHERLLQLIDQNLLAQENILKALTENYAKAAPILKTLADVKHKRETFFTSLAASYDVYEDLLSKSSKGLEFYTKLSANVQKLLSRCKSARDVQAEERQQRLIGVTSKNSNNSSVHSSDTYNFNSSTSGSVNCGTPKLRDYLKSKNISKELKMATVSSQQYIPSIRPNPLGSEDPSQAACSGNSYYPNSTAASVSFTVGPNEPPPPYSLQQTPFYDANITGMPNSDVSRGYTNPMYMQYQQNIAPPAYKAQASPNSQFTALSANIAALSLQEQQYINYNNNYSTNTCSGQLAYNSPLGNSEGNINHYMTPQVGYNISCGQSTQSQPPEQQPVSSQPYAASASIASIPNLFPMGYNVASVAPAVSASSMPNVAPLVYGTSTISAATPATSMYDPTSGTPNISQMYSQTVSTATIPQLHATYGTSNNSTATTSCKDNYAQLIQQQLTNYNNYTVSTSVPTTQPLYIVTTQSIQMEPISAPVLQSTSLRRNQQPSILSSQANQPQFQQSQATQIPSSPYNLQNPSDPNIAFSSLINAIPPSSVTTNITCAALPVISSTANTSSYRAYGSSTIHPGYSFNTQSGIYEYGSGYHQTTAVSLQPHGQYTSASAQDGLKSQLGTTDSQKSGKINVATGFDSPIISHTARKTPYNTSVTCESLSSMNYYNPPYGYQANYVNSGTLINQNLSTMTATNQASVPPQPTISPSTVAYQQFPCAAIYMQSGTGTTANTQTTKSATTYATSTQQASSTPGQAEMQAAAQSEGNSERTTLHNKTKADSNAKDSNLIVSTFKRSSNIDLLSDIDFSDSSIVGPPPMLPELILKPEVLSSPPSTQVADNEIPQLTQPLKDDEKQKKVEDYLATQISPITNTTSLQINSPVDSPAARKSSCDNLSNCSDLSSLENFEWDSVSRRSECHADKHSSSNNNNTNTFLTKSIDPFSDDKVLKYFHKEVERYEKIIDTLNVKMLNGHTPLTTKWKELQELLSKDNNKRSTTIARLFPEKNRSLDCLPYDHARVKLDKETDDYINAAHIKDLGNGCPNIIIAQTPQQNTVNDFWSMMWSQKARTVLCLHPSNEILDPFWPQTLEEESHFDDFSVKCVKIVSLTHCQEYQLKLSMISSDAIVELAILQIKTWTKSNPSQVVGIGRNILQAHQQRCLDFNTPSAPLVINCLTGSERSGLVAVALCAILATQHKRPILINVVDAWHRLCSHRQQVIRDIETLERSLQIVLSHAHDLLNKRGIMTSYQMKIAPQVTAQEKQATKDPLNELDALWKLK